MPSVQNATGGEASGAVADTRRMTLLLGATPDCQESLADLAMAVEIGNDEKSESESQQLCEWIGGFSGDHQFDHMICSDSALDLPQIQQLGTETTGSLSESWPNLPILLSIAATEAVTAGDTGATGTTTTTATTSLGAEDASTDSCQAITVQPINQTVTVHNLPETPGDWSITPAISMATTIGGDASYLYQSAQVPMSPWLNNTTNSSYPYWASLVGSQDLFNETGGLPGNSNMSQAECNGTPAMEPSAKRSLPPSHSLHAMSDMDHFYHPITQTPESPKPMMLPQLNDMPTISREVMREYLSTRKDCCITIQNAKVAQKSYGTEKRFFCPPPCIYMTGEHWHELVRAKPSVGMPPSCDNRAGADSSVSRAGIVDGGIEASDNKSDAASSKEADPGPAACFIGIEGGEVPMTQLEVSAQGYSVAKTLYISDSDKRKNFQLVARLVYPKQKIDIGTFKSNRIKVISKPSKKKQSVKNADLCIASGTTVALFNRLRSQTVSTRYLNVKGQQFGASHCEWGAFTIHIVPADEEENEEFTSCDGLIHYGDTIKLVCNRTGFSLPRLVIRKVDKQTALVGANDPVSQLHKVAFHMKDTARTYLTLSQEKVIQENAKASDKELQDSISDGACWTIISTHTQRYTFYPALGPVRDPISEVPLVHSLCPSGSNKQRTLELTGEDFSARLTVWFGEVPSKNTHMTTQQSIVCSVPDAREIDGDFDTRQSCLEVPVLLVRRDGVIYDTGHTYTYQPPTPNAMMAHSMPDLMSGPPAASGMMDLVDTPPLPSQPSCSSAFRHYRF